MPDLAQRLSSDVELAGAKTTHRVHNPKQVGSADEIRPPRPDERAATDRSRDSLRVAIVAIALTAAIAIIVGSYVFRSTHSNRKTNEEIDVKALVERIIKVESTGVANKRNKLSSATGAGQFLDDTWLEAVRKHRPDLIKGRSDKDLLKLRRDIELTREIITRLVKQYARTLRRQGLPLTPGSLSIWPILPAQLAPWRCYPAQNMPTPPPLWPPLMRLAKLPAKNLSGLIHSWRY